MCVREEREREREREAHTRAHTHTRVSFRPTLLRCTLNPPVIFTGGFVKLVRFRRRLRRGCVYVVRVPAPACREQCGASHVLRAAVSRPPREILPRAGITVRPPQARAPNLTRTLSLHACSHVTRSCVLLAPSVGRRLAPIGEDMAAWSSDALAAMVHRQWQWRLMTLYPRLKRQSSWLPRSKGTERRLKLPPAATRVSAGRGCSARSPRSCFG